MYGIGLTDTFSINFLNLSRKLVSVWISIHSISWLRGAVSKFDCFINSSCIYLSNKQTQSIWYFAVCRFFKMSQWRAIQFKGFLFFFTTQANQNSTIEPPSIPPAGPIINLCQSESNGLSSNLVPTNNDMEDLLRCSSEKWNLNLNIRKGKPVVVSI